MAHHVPQVRGIDVALRGGVEHCPRCGFAHPDPLDWHLFEQPPENSDGAKALYWAPCPSNGDPILLWSWTHDGANWSG